MIMKKFYTLLTLLMLLPVALYANDNTSVIQAENSASGNVIIEVLVEANAAVDDLCNYFNGSMVDQALKIYCLFNKASVVCAAYKVVKLSCSINGAVKLAIEGDWNHGVRQAIVGAAEVYVLSKVGRDSFQLKPSPRNYTPIPDDYNW